MVLGAGLDPAFAVRPRLLFPEGRARLQLVHEKIRRLEGGPSVFGGHRDEDDRLADLHPPPAMRDQHVLDDEPQPGLGLELGHHLAGVAGIGVDLQLGHRRPVGGAPRQSGEGHDRARLRPARAECVQQCAGIDGFILEPDHLSRR